MDRNFYVFRTDPQSKDWIWEEITKGWMHQGWGGSGTQLKEDNSIVEEHVWIERYKECSHKLWNYEPTDQEAKRRYWILFAMVEMKENDILVIPKMPDYDTFSIAVVEGAYNFEFSRSDKRCEQEDFRHTIRLRKESLKSFHYSSSPESKMIRNKLSAYRTAINRVSDPDFIEVLKELLGRKSNLIPKDLGELITELNQRLYPNYVSGLRNLGHLEVERIVQIIFEKAGFECIGGNFWDRKGGDADLIFSKSIPLISELVDFDFKVYVQVKAKKGIDLDDIVGVEQLLKITESDVSAIKVLISTADDFTTPCKMKAQENEILLFAGKELFKMATKYL